MKIQVRFLPLVTLSIGLCAFAGPVASQAVQRPQARRVAEPLHSVHLDWKTGVLTRGAQVKRGALPGFSTVTTLDNMDFSGFAGASTGPAGPMGPTEWIDAADKGFGTTGGASGLMTGFSFAYGTYQIDPASGGPGAKVRIGFREGYTAGSSANSGGPSGTEVGAFLMSGLPGTSVTGTGANPALSTFLLNVDLGTVPTVLVDGPIGWSWRFVDPNPGGLPGPPQFSSTLPFLSAVQVPGPDPTGNMVDRMDSYAPVGTFNKSFSFGTSFGSSFTSVSLQINEAEAIAPMSTVFNGGGSNQLILNPGAGPALGQPYSVTLDCTGANPSQIALWRISFLPPPAPSLTAWGELLVSLSGAGKNFLAPHGGGVATLGGFSLPLDLSFYGSTWNIQGFCGDSPLGFLSNGLTQTLGF